MSNQISQAVKALANDLIGEWDDLLREDIEENIQTLLDSTTAALIQQRDDAIKEIGEWSRKYGKVEQENEALKKEIERLKRWQEPTIHLWLAGEPMDCKIIDTGYSDVCFTIEVPEAIQKLEALKRDKEAKRQYAILFRPGKIGKSHVLYLQDCKDDVLRALENAMKNNPSDEFKLVTRLTIDIEEPNV